MDVLLDLVRDQHGVWTLAAVFAAALLEYVVPPLPADTVVLASSILVIAGVWPFPAVFIAAVLGGLVGSLLHYALGRLLLDEAGGLRGRRFIERLTGRGSVDRFLEAFRRRGFWVIALNRFFPGVRAGVFLAAGAARLSLGRTMLSGLVSNVAWTALLLSLGIVVGDEWERIDRAIGIYSRSFVILALCFLASLVFFRFVRRRSVLGSRVGPDGERAPVREPREESDR